MNGNDLLKLEPVLSTPLLEEPGFDDQGCGCMNGYGCGSGGTCKCGIHDGCGGGPPAG